MNFHSKIHKIQHILNLLDATMDSEEIRIDLILLDYQMIGIIDEYEKLLNYLSKAYDVDIFD